MKSLLIARESTSYENELNDLSELHGIPRVETAREFKLGYNEYRNKDKELGFFSASGDNVHGLANYGNTCYLNAIIYLIANTSLKKIVNTDKSFCPQIRLKKSLKILLKSMKSHTSYYQHNQALKNFINDVNKYLGDKFAGSIYDQQDAAEFLGALLDALGVDGSKFEMIQRELITSVDHFEPVIYDLPYKMLRLPLEGSTINDLISSYFVKTIIEPNFDTDHFVSKTKRFGLLKAPQTLLIHLMRFSQFEKIRSAVEIERYLSLTTYAADGEGLSGRQELKSYRLKALVVHRGFTKESGHYVSYQLKYKKTGTCLIKYDDDKISRVPMSELSGSLENDTYLLAYELKN